MYETVVDLFMRRYDGKPRVFSAPGRINLIGEHTDYNAGFVLPMAIQQRTWVAASPRADRSVKVQLQTGEERSFNLDQAPDKLRGHWLDYVEGTARTLAGAGLYLGGADLLICSDIPMGAGLSSSAALELAVGKALAALSGDPRADDHRLLALAGQRAEHEYVGTRCGLMDQFACALSREDHALFMDCRSLATTAVPLLMGSLRIVVCDTRVRHELATSEYNLRRRDCEAAVRRARKAFPHVTSLRDLASEDFDVLEDYLDPLLFRRARHVITENARTLQAMQALQRNEASTLGQLMTHSHLSLRDDYQVSCKELDIIVDTATAQPGVLGARMTGGGFGGSAIVLVDAAAVQTVCEQLTREFSNKVGWAPVLQVALASGGLMEHEGNPR